MTLDYPLTAIWNILLEGERLWEQKGEKLLYEKDKYQYLLQYITADSRTREIVDSYPWTANNYAKAIDSLKFRLGDEEIPAVTFVNCYNW